MSSNPPPGRYHFQAWARRGIAANIPNADNGSLPDRASLKVQISLQVQGGSNTNPVLPTPTTVELFGPGDIAGIDPRQVIRTEPRQFTSTFEPNYLCGIDFDTPDFPWLFTPAAPQGDRLHPWVALIVLKTAEFTPGSTPPNPLPTISVLNISALQDLATSWNWAHVQISGEDSLSDSLANAPGNVISRLLCPRRLDPETSYSAFLVPAFSTGVQAGLSGDVSSLHTSIPAWTKDTPAPFTLPFYYRFDFTTSDEGDFESLVRRLTPTPLPATVGQRLMDVDHSDPGLPPAGGPLGLDGALQSVSTPPSNWSGPTKDAFQMAVQNWINQITALTDDPNNPVDYGDPSNPSKPKDPVIVPPIYGRWHAAVTSVDRTAPGWMNDLNLDPRNRSGAGMGTQVIQIEQTQLMASAWQQVSGILQANQMLKQAQLARAVTQQLHRQHFQPAQPETLLYFTAPLHSRMLASPTTVTAAIRGSCVPERMFSGAFRKIARLPWHLGMAQNGVPTLLTRVNNGSIAITPTIKPPAGMVSIYQISNQAATTPATTPTTSTTPPLVKWWQWIIIALILLLLVGTLGILAALGIMAVAAVAVVALWSQIKSLLTSGTPTNPIAPVPPANPGAPLPDFTPQAVAQLPPNPGFQITDPGTVLPPGGVSGTTDSAQAAAFRMATEKLFAVYQSLPPNPAPLPSLDILKLQKTILARIDPVTTVPRRLQGLINVSSRLAWQPADPLEPIMAAPEFPKPMYAPLRDLSEQYMLPGAEQVNPDTVGLLQVNRAFIEAYMVGLNHEMARQLLWAGYPTDQRGSYFRQFWDVSAYVPQPTDPTDPVKLEELLKDIPLINTWPLPVPLGHHPNRTDIVQNNLVLLVRGELFRRYPNAVVYVVKAKRDLKGNRVLDDTDERYHLFRGTLSPDMTFLGFNLTAADAQGGTTTAPDGYFFVFQEQPSEPRFGLEPNAGNATVNHWADLSWTNFATGAAAPASGPAISNPSPFSIEANSPWRMASRVFARVIANTQLPDSLKPNVQPTGVTIAAGGGNPTDPDYTPTDPNNQWGVNSAQTAYILFRRPFRILIHAKLMLPT